MTIINLANTRALRNQQSKTDIFFPVEEFEVGAVSDDDVYIDTLRKAIVRTDTYEVLGIHKNSYKLITNKEIFGEFDGALRQSNLDLSGMTIKDTVLANGARTIRQYRFPAHSINVNPQRNDIINMELKVVNSYDGSVAFQSFVGGNRLICENGMVAFNQFMQTYGKHTSRLDIESTVYQVNKALTVYLQQQEYWKKWINITISESQVIEILKQLPGINERLFSRLHGLYLDEQMELGSTIWALYNALTYWSTHEDVRTSSEKNRASIQMEREMKVRRVLSTDTFKRIAA